MSINFESVFKSNLNNYMDDVYTSLPARVVGIQNIQDGLIDVQPLINNLFEDGSKLEFPTIYSVPVMMPSTNTTSITMPINHGDTVWLMFSQRDMDVFKNGADSPHDPSSFRKFNMNDAVALIGLTPINRSKLSSENHNIEYDNNNLVITHNIGTDRESHFTITNSGVININGTSEVNIVAPVVSIDSDTFSVNADSVNINASTVDVKATVMIDGMNLNQFMKNHFHKYTDNGNPMQTSIPEGY